MDYDGTPNGTLAELERNSGFPQFGSGSVVVPFQVRCTSLISKGSSVGSASSVLDPGGRLAGPEGACKAPNLSPGIAVRLRRPPSKLYPARGRGDSSAPQAQSPPFTNQHSSLLYLGPKFIIPFVAKIRIPDDAMEYFRKTGAMGGKARARKHSKKQLSEWAKLGGRPKGSGKGKKQTKKGAK